LLPLVLEERGCSAAQGPSGGRIRVDNGQVKVKVPHLVPGPQKDVRRASAVPGDVHLAVMRDAGLGKDLAEKGLSAKVPLPEARLLA